MKRTPTGYKNDQEKRLKQEMGQTLCGAQSLIYDSLVALRQYHNHVTRVQMKMDLYDEADDKEMRELGDKICDNDEFWLNQQSLLNPNNKIIRTAVLDFRARERNVIQSSIVKLLRNRHHEFMLNFNPHTSRQEICQLVGWTIRICIKHKIPTGVRKILADKVTADYFSMD